LVSDPDISERPEECIAMASERHISRVARKWRSWDMPDCPLQVVIVHPIYHHSRHSKPGDLDSAYDASIYWVLVGFEWCGIISGEVGCFPILFASNRPIEASSLFSLVMASSDQHEGAVPKSHKAYRPKAEFNRRPFAPERIYGDLYLHLSTSIVRGRPEAAMYPSRVFTSNLPSRGATAVTSILR
jgi:hypothetical protein